MLGARHFDGFNFAVRANSRALLSVGLMDFTCPPSTVFAAYNHYAGEKEIKVWSYNDHEGGESFQMIEKMKFLTGLWCYKGFSYVRSNSFHDGGT